MSRIHQLLALSLAAVCLLELTPIFADEIDQPTNRLIAAKLSPESAPMRINCTTNLRCSLSLTGQYYKTESGQAVWVHNEKLIPAAKEMLEIIRDSYQEGLNPADYHLKELSLLENRILAASQAGMNPDPQLFADFDVTLSDAFLLYAKHSVYGRVDNLTVYPKWIISKRSANLTELLAEVGKNHDLKPILAQLQPRYIGYNQLKVQLNHYQEIAEEGGWESISSGATLKLGSKGRNVAILQHRLAASNQFAKDSSYQEGVFNQATRQALMRFQKNNHLKVSGVVDARTKQALNVSVIQLIKTIELNMDRLRWLPLDMGWRYILVNIPNFSLVVIKDGEPYLEMPVIVGKESNRSCILSSKITYLELNPFWTIPDSIAKKELLPKLQQNANYLAKDQIKVYTSFADASNQVNPLMVNWNKISPASLNYKFRQEPGPKNSLGRVKFIFPNDCGIYLHDTPSRNLFGKSRRDFSHGCIRIGKPIEMANYLLADKPHWSPERIESQIETGKRQLVYLTNPIDIHIIYATAWVNSQGDLEFSNDIYGIDNVDYPVYLPSSED